MIEPSLHNIGTAPVNEARQPKQSRWRKPIACHVQSVEFGAGGTNIPPVNAPIQKRDHLVLDLSARRAAQQVDQLAFGATAFQAGNDMQYFHTNPLVRIGVYIPNSSI